MTVQQRDRQETFSGPGIPAIDAYIEQYWTLTHWDGIPISMSISPMIFAEEAGA
jgi:hypothetical protein